MQRPFLMRGCLRRFLSLKCHAPAEGRLFCSSTFVARSSSTTHVPHSVNEDFFVDIDSLAGLSAAALAPATSTSSRAAPAPSPPSSSSTTTDSVAPSDVLGVVRHTPEDENARYSRLNVPLAPADGGKPSTGMRSNTRAGLPLGEEAAYADTCAAAAAGGGGTTEAADGARAVSASTGVQPLEGDGGAEEDGRLPDPARLPYDDERFAEMLLEMEVNGVIDETWQDSKKAHLEDVKELADILTSLKVRDLCCIDVSEKTASFDYMLFGTCDGPRHIHLAAWAAQDADKVHRISKIKRKQTDELWEVVPIGRIVVNLMVESFREEMTLERKWAVTRTMDPLAAANAPISEGRQVKAHGLWTLTLNLQDLEDFEVDYCKDVLMRQM